MGNASKYSTRSPYSKKCTEPSCTQIYWKYNMTMNYKDCHLFSNASIKAQLIPKDNSKVVMIGNFPKQRDEYIFIQRHNNIILKNVAC